MTDELDRARELLEEAERDVTIVGLGHAIVAVDAGRNGRDPEQAARQADRRIKALFERDCGVPSEHARRCLREARQVLAVPQEVPA